MDLEKINPSLDGGGIQGKNRYKESEGLLGTILEGLDYAGNISRSAVAGFDDDGLEGLTKYALQAAKKKRQTSATELKDRATEALGVGKVRFGKDDKKFQWGDVLDVSTDMLFDVFTDPVSLLTMGANTYLKGGKAATKVGKNSKKAYADLQRLKNNPKGLRNNKDAFALHKKLEAGKAGIGAVYGVGTADQDDSLGEKVLKGLAGASLGVMGPKAMGAAGIAAKKAGDAAVDHYMVSTRGTKYKNFSRNYKIAKEVVDRFRSTAEQIRQGRLKALDGLTPTQQVKAQMLMRDIKNYHINTRNKVLKKKGYKADKKTVESKEFRDFERKLNHRINKDIDRKFLPELLKNEEDAVVNAITQWGKHNERVYRALNRATREKMTPVKYHIPDIYETKDEKMIAKYLKAFDKDAKIDNKAIFAKRPAIQRASRGVSGDTVEKLAAKYKKEGMNDIDSMRRAFDDMYGVYAEGFSKKFVNNFEQKALKLMSEYKETKPVQMGARILERGAGAFDKMTNLMKANMLYFSMTWLKTNYWDNMAKAYVEDGVHGLVDSGTLGLAQRRLASDIWGLYGNKHKKFKEDLMLDGMRNGAIDGQMFRSLVDDDVAEFLKTPIEKARDIKKREKLLYKPIQAAEKWQEMLGNTVGRLGSYMEGYARMATYGRNREMLIKSGMKPQAASKIAGKLVNDAFFDYNAVTYGEKAILKRAIPFYAFYSKNLPYWLQATVDPLKAGRIVNLESARSNIGEEPSKSDKEGLTDYILGSSPRYVGKTKDGGKEYMIFPSMSLHDAFKMIPDSVESVVGQLIEKGNPYLKLPMEAITGKDLFTGGKVNPSEIEEGKKYLFSRGFKFYAANKAMKALGLPTMDVHLDDRGNPYSTSNLNVWVDKIISTAFPHGAIDQLAGSIGKVKMGKEDLDEAIMNRLLPAQKVKVSPGMMKMQKSLKRLEKMKKRDRDRK